MRINLKCTETPSHTYCNVFTNGGLSGELCFRNAEFPLFYRALLRSAAAGEIELQVNGQPAPALDQLAAVVSGPSSPW